MNIDQVINLLVTVALVELMATLGLSVTAADLLAVAKDWRLLSAAALANYVCVPAATVGLLLLFDPHPMVAAGFLILAVCPGAPYGPPFTAIAKGNVPAAVGLMIVLAGSSAILAPLLLRFLLPWVTGDERVQLDAVRMVVTLFVTQLLPLAAGLALAQWRPTAAARVRTPAILASKILNLLAVAVILAVQFPLLAQVRPMGYLGMIALLAISLIAGWLLGGPGRHNRKALALTTALRNAGVGLVLAASSFPGTPALTAVLAYAIIELFGSFLLACVWSRNTRSPALAEQQGSLSAPGSD
jgi:BASS family bile acid:Na+ symporter